MSYQEDLAYVHHTGFAFHAEGATRPLLALLKDAAISSGPVLDLGCGSGIWAAGLARAGYSVTAVDYSEAMIDIAREQTDKVDFEVDSWMTYDVFRGAPYRVVTALGEVLNYRFDGHARASVLTSFFRRVFDALEPGGLFIFDVAEQGRDRGRAPGSWLGDDWACMTRFSYDEKRHRLTRHIVTFREVDGHYRRHEEDHVLQLYVAADLLDALRKIGFRVRRLRSYGDYEFPKSFFACVARKPTVNARRRQS